MKADADIVRLSVPFVAGVGLSAWIDAPTVCASAALAAVAACFFFAARSGRRTAVIALLFLGLGVLCHSGAAILPFRNPAPSAASGALGKLSALIDGLPFSERETNALLKTFLTGQRKGLGKALSGSFRAAGASHLLALSGLHLGVIYLILSKLLAVIGNSRLAYAVRSVLIVACSAFYVLMTGASPSIVRAFLFILLAEIARNCPGRSKTPLSVWCTALLIQLVFRPEVISSTGFQLSYLAMLGIFLLYPSMKEWYPGGGSKREKWNPLRRMWEAMALSTSCQLFTAPLVWITFHTFPRYFLLTNLIALPLTEALIACGVALTALAAFGSSPVPLLRLTDCLSFALRRSLDIIASLSS